MCAQRFEIHTKVNSHFPVISAMQAARSLATRSARRLMSTYSEKMDATGRPISPHITIYAWPTIAISSVMMRATGMMLSIGAPSSSLRRAPLALACAARRASSEASQCQLSIRRSLRRHRGLPLAQPACARLTPSRSQELLASRSWRCHPRRCRRTSRNTWRALRSPRLQSLPWASPSCTTGNRLKRLH